VGLESFRYHALSEDGRFDFREEELEGALAFQGEQVQVKLQHWSQAKTELLKKAEGLWFGNG
jgi:hypothetical protein